MKIRIGGEVDMKVMAKAYEPVSAKAIFEIEIEDESFEDETIEMFQEKVRKQLQKQLTEQMKIALKEYQYTKKNIQNIMDT